MAGRLNARLDHLVMESPAPAELAAFYAKALRASAEKVGGEWMVSREGRSVHFTCGQSRRVAQVEVTQTARLDELVFGVPHLISYLSDIMPLQPGDIIATGTPGGVGAFREPPVWMKTGDRVEVEILAIGILINGIVDEA